MRLRTLTPLERGLIIYLIVLAVLLALAWGVNACIDASPARSLGSTSLAPLISLLL
jgi:hypothetical protein